MEYRFVESRRKYCTAMDNVLDPFDQFTFDAERATGVASVPHPYWVYDRPVDIDGLRKFQHHFQQGLLSRRIQPSPLPFGRHRWVSAEGSSGIGDIEICLLYTSDAADE